MRWFQETVAKPTSCPLSGPTAVLSYLDQGRATGRRPWCGVVVAASAFPSSILHDLICLHLSPHHIAASCFPSQQAQACEDGEGGHGLFQAGQQSHGAQDRLQPLSPACFFAAVPLPAPWGTWHCPQCGPYSDWPERATQQAQAGSIWQAG